LFSANKKVVRWGKKRGRRVALKKGNPLRLSKAGTVSLNYNEEKTS